MEETMRTEKGFSLTEVLSVIVILAVLAGISIPNFTRSRDKAAANQAVASLRILRLGDQMFFARNGVHACNGTCDGVPAINAALGTEIMAGGFAFTVTDDAATFEARRGTCTLILTNASGLFTTVSDDCRLDAATLNA